MYSLATLSLRWLPAEGGPKTVDPLRLNILPLRSEGDAEAELLPPKEMDWKKEEVRERKEPGVSGKGELGSRVEEVEDSAVWRGWSKGVAREG